MEVRFLVCAITVHRLGQIVLHGSVNWVAMFLTDIRSKNKTKRVMILVNFNSEQYWTMELTETNVSHISKGLQALSFLGLVNNGTP